MVTEEENEEIGEKYIAENYVAFNVYVPRCRTCGRPLDAYKLCTGCGKPWDKCPCPHL